MKTALLKIAFVFVFAMSLMTQSFGQQEPKISLYGGKFFIIKPNKTLWFSGSNIGLDNVNNTLSYIQVDNNAYNAISSYWDMNFVLRNDSTIWGWGNNYYGQLGDSTAIDRTSLTRITKDKFISVETKNNTTFAIKNDSTLWAWGREFQGQFADNKSNINGYDTSIIYNHPVKILNDKFLKVSVNSQILAIKSDSTLWAWGYNYNGQLGDGTKLNKKVPVKISNFKFISVLAGESFSFAIKSDSTLWAWGYNGYGTLGLGDFNERLIPTQVGIRKYKSVSASYTTVIAIDVNNELYIWGNSSTGLYKTFGNITNNIPTKLDTEKYIKAVTDGNTIIAQKTDGSIIGWGSNNSAQLGLNKNYNYTDIQTVKNTSDNNSFTFLNQNIYGGSYLAQKSNGSIWAWGYNADGYLGVNDKIDKAILTNIPVTTPLTKISKGATHAFGLDANNKLWAWGENNGNFGDNSYANSSIPVQVGNDTYKFAGAELQYSVFIKTDGTLWTSGTTTWANQLGTGVNQSSVYTKVKIDNVNTYLTAFPGVFGTFAIKSDSSLWAWGSNWDGWLGDGTTVDKFVPTRITGTKFKKISSLDQVLAIENNGNLWVWGSNYAGQVGNGTSGQPVLTPTKISSEVWIDVTAAGQMSYAIKSDSTLWAWGRRNDGLFGAGTPTSSTIPVKVSNLKFKSINATWNEIVALKSDGTIISLGVNSRGSLGIGELDFYTTAQTIFAIPPPTLNYTSNKVVSSGSQIMVRGENLSNTSAITYNGTSCTYVVITDNLIKVNIPTTSTSGNLVLTTPTGSASLGGIMYVSPQSSSAPIDIVLTNNLIEENNSTNRAMGHFIADDAESDVNKFELVSGTGADDNASFSIDSNRLVAMKSFDYETKNQYSIRVKATDATGLSIEKSFKINIIDEPESILNKTNVKVALISTTSGFILKNDSTLWGWSSNNYGQLGDSTNIPKYGLVQITQDKFMDFATNGNTVLGIKADSTLWAWGYNTSSYGTYGDGSIAISYYPIKVSTDKFSSVSISSNYHVLAIRSDGTLWTWGNNIFGQLGDGTTVAKTTRVKISNDKFIDAKATSYSSFAIKSDGSLWAWGYNNYGQLGDGTKVNKSIPAIISNDKFKSLGIHYSYYYTNYAMGADSTIWSWGANDFGQLGLGLASTDSVFNPRKISNDKYIDFSNGGYYAMAIKTDSTLWGVGLNSGNRMGDTVTTYTNTFRKISNTKYARIFAASSSYSMAVLNTGIAYWYGQGNLNNIFKYRPTYVNDFTKVSNAKNLIADYSKTTQKTDQSWWLNNTGYNNIAADLIQFDKVKLKNYNFVKIDGNGSTYLGLTKNGELYAWGYNYYGQLGDGTSITNYTPTRIGTDKFIDLSISGYNSLAIKEDGSLWSWGLNNSGQIGDSTTTTRYVPTKIDAGPFVSVYTSNNFSSYAIKQDGTLYAWGQNSTGQLGDGTTTNRYFPTQIGTNKYIKITPAGNHVIALAKDSTVWTWGYNSYGQIGDNTTNPRTTPYQINIGNNAKFIDISADAGGASYAIKSDGSLYSWGNNTYGLLGDGSFTNYLQPKIASTDVFKSISQRNSGTVQFIKQDSSTYMLGYTTNNYYVTTTSYFSMMTPLFNLYPNYTPYSPATTDTSYCSTGPAILSLAKATNGNSLLYYTQATGGTATAALNVPIANRIDTLNYFVSQINTRGFQSARAKLSVIIKATPAKPIVATSYYCQGDAGKIATANALSGNKLLWYGTSATGGTSTSTAPAILTTNVSNYNYYVSQKSDTTGCESDRAALPIYISTPLSTPIISRDASSNLVSSATYGNSWYKDGVKISDTTNTFKPTAIGKYTVKSSFLGCTSLMSGEYYYLITDVININASEFIKLVPNPFSSQINIDYSIKGYQKLSVEIFDIATGNRAGLIENVSAGSSLFLGNLSSGTYLIKVSSPDHKQSYQFKMIKL